MEERKIDVPEEEKIDLFRVLSEFLRAFRRLFWLPLILAAALGAVSGWHQWRSYTPMYASEVTFTIQMTDSALSDLAGMTAYYDKATAEQLSKTFPYLVQSDVMQSKLRQELGVEWINGSITAKTVNNTNLFSIRVTSSDPQAAYDILNTVIRVYPEVADYVIGSTRMNLLTEPAVAQQPYNSFNPARTVAKGAVMGAVLGLLAVLAYAFTRRSIREAEDVRQMLNQTCLAALPHVTLKKRSGGTQTLCILNSKVPGAFQECVRGMRLKFLREAEKHQAHVVMVTSTLPGEGKTTAAVNLALTLSRSGYRVILMDLDLRKPSVKQALGLDVPSRGMPEVLSSAGESAVGALVPAAGGRPPVRGTPPPDRLPPAEHRGEGAAGPGGLCDPGHPALRSGGGQRRPGPLHGRNRLRAAQRHGTAVPRDGQPAAAVGERHAAAGLRGQRRGRQPQRLRLWLRR